MFALPGQWRQAADLVSATTAELLGRGRGLILGDVIASPVPLIDGSRIGGVLAHTNPFLDAAFDAEPDGDGGYSRQIVTLFPLTVAEASSLREQTSDDAIERFLDHLEETGLDETDLLRDDSVVTSDATPGSGGPVSDDLSVEGGSQDDRLGAVGRRYFSELAPGADLRIIPLEDGAGVCVVHTARGGGKIYVAPDESVLFVGSAMDFDAGLAAFLAGTRTPPEKFVRPTS